MTFPRLKSIAEVLQTRAEMQADRVPFTFLRGGEEEEAHLTFKELDHRARLIAHAIRAHVGEGSRVLINHSPGLDYVASLFGCFYARVVAVPVYPPRFNSKLDRLISISESAQAEVALTSASLLESMRSVIDHSPLLSKLTWVETDRLDDIKISDHFGDPDEEDLALIQYTSGSTSEPKGVMLSHANLMANVKCICEKFELSEKSSSVVWLPPYHDMGLIGGLMPPVWLGFPMVLMSPYSFVQKPARWLKAMSKYGGTVSGAPNFAYDLCTRKIREDQIEGIDLSKWNVAFCGAEPIRNSVLDAFAERFKPYGFQKEALYPCYGLAESTLIATGGEVAKEPIVKVLDPEKLEKDGIVESLTPSEKRGRSVVGCGVPVGRHSVVIVDPELHVELPEGRVGEIWLSGPSIAKGYWKKPKETAETFQASLSGDTSGAQYLRTGDLGFLQDGELFVTGRKKDLLIIRGRNFYPQDIEFTASRSHKELASSNAAAFSVVLQEEEKLVLLQEADRTVPDTELDGIIGNIRRQVFEDHGVMPYAVSIVRRNGLPLTSSGKIQRFLCRKMFLEGSLKERRSFLEN